MKTSILKTLDLHDGLAVTVAMLHAYPMQYLGVIGLDGRPKVKAFEFKFAEDGKLWFDTVKGHDTWKEITHNPYVQLSVADAETTDWIRISGKVRIVDDQQKREKMFAVSPILTKYHGGPENKDVMPFTLDEVEVEVASLAQNVAPHRYQLR